MSTVLLCDACLLAVPPLGVVFFVAYQQGTLLPLLLPGRCGGCVQANEALRLVQIVWLLPKEDDDAPG